MKINPSKVLYCYRNKYDTNKSVYSAEKYIAELEAYIPNEIIDEYAYEQAFKEVLSLIKETFRPDHFNSAFMAKQGELVHWLDLGFMEWLLAHQSELTGLLSWNQICELQYNWMGWKLANTLALIPEKSIKEMWNYTNEKQTEESRRILNDRARQTQTRTRQTPR